MPPPLSGHSSRLHFGLCPAGAVSTALLPCDTGSIWKGPGEKIKGLGSQRPPYLDVWGSLVFIAHVSVLTRACNRNLRETWLLCVAHLCHLLVSKDSHYVHLQGANFLPQHSE